MTSEKGLKKPFAIVAFSEGGGELFVSFALTGELVKKIDQGEFDGLEGQELIAALTAHGAVPASHIDPERNVYVPAVQIWTRCGLVKALTPERFEPVFIKEHALRRKSLELFPGLYEYVREDTLSARPIIIEAFTPETGPV